MVIEKKVISFTWRFTDVLREKKKEIETPKEEYYYIE